MSNFIPRLYKNIETNEKIRFDDLAEIHLLLLSDENEDDKQHQSNIAIILGEPASGKTFQLKQYNRTNSKSCFVELINLQNTDAIDKNIDVVLLDSIDEALTDYDNPKKLKDKLTRFIKSCMEINPEVKFVISCRFLEWNNYFEESLKHIDKELRVYEILPLSLKDINRLIKEQGKDSKRFLEFIHKNYLEYLLKNILIVWHLVESFEKYENSSSTYIDIYQNIAKKYLSQKGEDRQSEISDTPLEKLLLISSSLATYMTFNRKQSISVDDLEGLASELYKIDGKEILASDLELVLSRGLFKKKENNVKFFHHSLQEYLTAYFLVNKNISADVLKNFLANELRFYEEFEEVVVYLTNMKPELFDEFVNFDPFIFKRHPNLSKNQQEKLLLSILNKYKNNFSQVWGRWSSFEGTTLVKFDKLDNLVEILKKNATLQDHGFYLMKLVEYNYTNKLEKYIFQLFEENVADKKTLRNVIRDNFVNNYNFNLTLFKFLRKYNLLKKDEHAVFMSFEVELFSSLYGIKYRYKYGEDRATKRTDIDFTTIVSLLDYVPVTSLKYVVPYLLKEDAKEWFEYVIDRYNKKTHTYEFMNWVVYAVLKYCDSEKYLLQIISNLKEKKIFLYPINRKEVKLNLDLISDSFWKVYFETDAFEDLKTKRIIDFFNISLKDIKKATLMYPIKDYVEKYVYFRLLGDNVDKLLMLDKYFNRYMQNEWKKQKKLQQKMDEEYRTEFSEIGKKEQDEKQFRDETFSRFATDDEIDIDLHNICIFTLQKHSTTKEQEKYLQENLVKKYPIFRKRIKQRFQKDIFYKVIKKDLLSSNYYYDTFCFNYLFKTATSDELIQLIKSKKDYIKLFWHIYKKSLNSFSDKFIQLSTSNFECFVLLSLQALKITLDKSNYTTIGNFYLSINAFKEKNKFDFLHLKIIVEYLVKNSSKIMTLNELHEKDLLLELLALDKNNYSIILKLMSKDAENLNLYLKYLLRIDTPKALSDFFQLYNSERRYKSFLQIVKEHLFKKHQKLNKYNNPKIYKNKIRLFAQIMKSLKNAKDVLDAVPEEYFKEILRDYYEFFSEYETPKGVYTPDIYDTMYRLINNIWNHIQNTKYIEILKDMQNSKNNRLSNMAKNILSKAYENQRKEKNYPNSYYKEIFNREKNMDKNNIKLKINGNQNNIAINSKNINQKTYIQSKNKDNIWWLYSGIAGFITIVSIWWIYDSLIYAFVGGAFSFAIVWKLNPKFRFRNIGYSLIGTGILCNIISFSGQIIIPKNSFIYGVIKIGENNVSILLIVLSISFFILDYFENRQ